MLKLKVQGRYLNLPDDIQINLTIENPLLQTERVPIPNTLSFELDPTDNNIKTLGYPNRLNSTDSFRTYSDSSLEYGPSVLVYGTFVVLGFDKTIRCQMVGVFLNDNFKKPALEIPIQRYDFGPGSPAFPNFSSAFDMGFQYKTKIQASIAGTEKFVAGPVKLKAENWPLTDESTFPVDFGIYATSKMYFNFFNARDENYMLDSGEQHTVVFPQPFVHEFLNAVFGNVLEINPFSSGDLADLILITSYHPKFYEFLFQAKYGILIDDYPAIPTENYFELASFMPSMTANDIVKELLKVICATMYFVNGKIQIVLNKDILASTEVEDWTNKLTGTLATKKNAAQTYSCGYSDFPQEEANSSGITTLDTIADLISAVVSTEEPVNFYITSHNQVISKRKLRKDDPMDPDRWGYNIVNSNFGTISGGQNAFDMVSKISPLQMNVENYWWLYEPEFEQWYVPVWTGDRLIRPDKCHIMFYHGLKETFATGDHYPSLSSHNIDHHGTRVNDTSLHFGGADGMMAQYHSTLKVWVEKDKLSASGVCLLSALDLKKLDLKVKKHIKGKNFFIEKIGVTIRKFSIDPSQVDFIEA